MKQNSVKKDKEHFFNLMSLRKYSFWKMLTETPVHANIFSSPSIKKESVEGDEPMDGKSSSEWDLLLQAFPSLSDSKDVPGLLQRREGEELAQQQLWVRRHKITLTYLSKVVPGTLLDNGWACPVSFLPAGNPMGMEEEGCKERPARGTSLNEESGNQNGCFMCFHRGQ